jgi:pre-60S factor REI1
MHTEHAMSIPNADTVIDLQSFVGYLATEVRTWHECLYCGAIKQSTLSIQSHMRDKGHCRLNFDREPELVDFWEQGQCEDEDIDAAGKEEEQKVDLSATEIYFASGRVVSSRHAAKARKNASRERSPATLKTISLPHGGDSIPPIVAPELASRQHLSCRQEMGLLGVSVQQRQALVVVEKKAQRSEAAARRAREWVYAKGANSQKFDQVDNQMKWGKQNHKLLPR